MDLENSPKNFYQQTFSNLSLNSAHLLGKEFENCIFENCSFIETTFEKCIFTDCTFNGCVMSAVKINLSSFSEVKFHNSKVIGIDWTKVQALRSLEFHSSQITYSNFKLLKLTHLKVIDCQANEVDFSGTDLSEADFHGSNLEKTRFLNTNLHKANFQRALNYSIDPQTNKLKKTIFSLPEAISLLDHLDIILEN